MQKFFIQVPSAYNIPISKTIQRFLSPSHCRKVCESLKCWNPLCLSKVDENYWRFRFFPTTGKFLAIFINYEFAIACFYQAVPKIFAIFRTVLFYKLRRLKTLKSRSICTFPIQLYHIFSSIIFNGDWTSLYNFLVRSCSSATLDREWWALFFGALSFIRIVDTFMQTVWY